MSKFSVEKWKRRISQIDLAILKHRKVIERLEKEKKALELKIEEETLHEKRDQNTQ